MASINYIIVLYSQAKRKTEFEIEYQKKAREAEEKKKTEDLEEEEKLARRRKREKEAQQHLLDMQAAAVDLEINLDRKAFLVEKEKKGFFDRRRGRHDSNFQTAADEKGFELFRQEQYNKQTEFDRRTHSSARSSPCRDYQYHGTSHRDADKRGSEFKQPRYDRRTHASAQLSYTDDHQYHGSSRRGAGERGSEFQQPRYDDRRTHALTQTSYTNDQYHGNCRRGRCERACI